MIGFVLAQLAQIAEPTATPVVGPAAMDQYGFWLAVIDRLVPLVDAGFKILAVLAVPLAGYLAVRTRALERTLGLIHTEVNGMKTELVRATEEKAFAAGVDKGAAAVAQNVVQPPTIAVQVVPADAQPGGRRKGDPPAPTSAPVERDPSSHQP